MSARPDLCKLQLLWQQPGLTQVGPAIQTELQHGELSVDRILGAVGGIDPCRPGVLLHYTDPFLMQAAPLRGLRQLQGPSLLACGDLHHSNSPIETLAAYLEAEPHDAVLLTFNPALVAEVRKRLRVPVRSLPPTFFCYPSAVRVERPLLHLLHVGSLGRTIPAVGSWWLGCKPAGGCPFAMPALPALRKPQPSMPSTPWC